MSFDPAKKTRDVHIVRDFAQDEGDRLDGHLMPSRPNDITGVEEGGVCIDGKKE